LSFIYALINDNAHGFEFLGGVHDLSLEDVPSLRDDHLRNLTQVHSLNLYNCQGITNVDCLSSIQELRISKCGGVSNVAELRDIPKLAISEIHPQATGFSLLRNGEELELTSVENLTVEILDSLKLI
jgi:hypothetical protein